MCNGPYPNLMPQFNDTTLFLSFFLKNKNFIKYNCALPKLKFGFD